MHIPPFIQSAFNGIHQDIINDRSLFECSLRSLESDITEQILNKVISNIAIALAQSDVTFDVTRFENTLYNIAMRKG